MRKIISIVLLPVALSLGADSIKAEDLVGVYYITPDNKTIEYRHTFTRTSIETVIDHHTYEPDEFYQFKAGNHTIKSVRKTRHYPAGFYYKDSDVEYRIPAGKQALYTLVKSPAGVLQRMIIWNVMHDHVTQDSVNADSIQRYDSWLKKMIIGGTAGGLFGYWWASHYDWKRRILYPLAGILSGSLVGHYCGSNKGLVDWIYMPDDVQQQLLKKMSIADDERYNKVKKSSLTINEWLDVDAPQSADEAHIEHFVIKPAHADDLHKAREGHYAEQGSIGYELPDERVQYTMTNKSALTVLASLKRLIGWN